MTLFVSPRQTEPNLNGVIAAGWTYYFYEVGTTTPKTVYSDSALTTALGTSVESVANGRFPAIFYDGAIKVVLHDADGVEQWTEDNYNPSFNPLTAATVAALAAQSPIVNTLIETKGYSVAGIGAATYLVKTAAQAAADGDVIDEDTNHTLANSNVAILQSATRTSQSLTAKSAIERNNNLIIDADESFTTTIDINSQSIISGGGGTLTKTVMGSPLLHSEGKSDVRLLGVNLAGTGHSGNDAASASIRIEANDGVDIENILVAGVDSADTSWGALVTAEVGAGAAQGVRYSYNYVHSTTPNTMADGLHMAGRITGAASVGNTVVNRADAGLAMNMTATHNGKGFALVGNASVDNLVGVDISGGKSGVVVGNACWSDIDHAASNPAMRAITYSGSHPEYLIFSSNLAIGVHTTSGEFDMKIDAAGVAVSSAVIGNTLQSFYTNAKLVNISNNFFIGNGRLTLDNSFDEVIIGRNSWSNVMSIEVPASFASVGTAYIAKQDWARSFPPNFLPNYGVTGGLFFATKYRFETDILPISTTPQSTSSTTNVDLTNGTFVLDGPVIVDRIIALADCASHSGYVAITSLDGLTEYCNARFDVTAGVGGTNIVARLNSPVSGSDPYKIKLDAGTYKIMIRSELNSLTVKNVSLGLWG